ncbi:nuclear transport factor 2 family protein [Cystobacter fuscus]|uniref:nuclear transport factor 2 family protein n=1 Tax=Cystobacter fuscus TaxID=43 RepID=UPI002B2E6CB5|nr:nuclear transport factor 2 family protein [Cystobacter fuscus]
MATSFKTTLFSFLAALTLSAPALAAAPSTQEVWQHHIKAWADQDVAAITSDYTDSSILILNNQVIRGKAGIARAFSQLFQIFSTGQNQLDQPTINGRIIYLTWRYTPKNENAFFGSDTFVVENGKIQIQTIASELYFSHPVKP